jgi:D-alanine-D-alanine ligase
VTNGKIRLALVFGGQSAEHDVSLSSARSVMAAVDPARYEVLPIAITTGGEWRVGAPAVDLLASVGSDDAGVPSTMALLAHDHDVADIARVLSPVGPRGGPSVGRPIDVVFPLLHGPRGEDGTVQGLFELAGVPYVGAGVAGSAVGMDKILMKNLFMQAGLPIVPFITLTRADWRRAPESIAARVADTIGYPCFVKPANMGSSIGISRVDAPDSLPRALDAAARHDRRLLVERGVRTPRELECGVLGNDEPAASVVGEIRVRDAAFYDYDAKYQPGASDLVIPADVPAALAERVRDAARRAFLTIDGAGMARVDFLLGGDGDLYISEINTIPGFTPTSMFPQLWAASGLPYPALIDRLVELALERHQR